MSSPRLDKFDKNYFINGAMEYFQRASIATAVTGTFDYITADRFEMKVDGTWTTPTSEQSTTTVGTRSRRSQYFSGTPTDLGDTYTIRQKIESINAIDLVNSNSSLSVAYKSNNFSTLTITLSIADVEDDFSAVTQVSQTVLVISDDSSDQRAVIENITAIAGAIRGLVVEFEFSGLSSLSATDLYLSEFKIGTGAKIQNFSNFGRNLIEELSYCQRYFETNNSPDIISVDPADYEFDFPNTIYRTTNSSLPTVTFTTIKRIPPVMTVIDGLGALGKVTKINVGGGSIHNQPTNGQTTNRIKFSVQTSISGGYAGYRYGWDADAEL